MAVPFSAIRAPTALGGSLRSWLAGQTACICENAQISTLILYRMFQIQPTKQACLPFKIRKSAQRHNSSQAQAGAGHADLRFWGLIRAGECSYKSAFETPIQSMYFSGRFP